MNKSLIIFGIVNITSDSFSDGGRYLAPDAAIAQARKLMAEGADVIDLGPASSNPDAAPVSSDTEIARIAPVLDALKADGIPVSLDSYQPATQAYAWHCCKVSDEAAFCLIQRPYISKTLLTRRISPRG
ncbi:dihydropteroate synthase, partial [Escherichia coli]